MLHYAAYVIATIIRRDDVSDREKAFHFVVWALWPPIYFFVEWFYLFPHFGLQTPEAVECFQHGQEAARNLWAGFVAVIAASYIADGVKSRDELERSRHRRYNSGADVATPPDA
jgi:hypothetical protein